MKKLLIAIALVMCSFLTNAQTGKGNWLLGGDAGFNSNKQGDYKSTDIFFSPDMGYFIADDLAIGAMLNVSSSKPSGGDASTTFSFAPFVRYYFVPLGDNAKLFGQGSFGFGSVKSDGDPSQSFTVWELAAGPAFFLNQHTALEVALFYSSSKFKDAADAYNSFGVKVGFQIHFGGGKAASKKK